LNTFHSQHDKQPSPFGGAATIEAPVAILSYLDVVLLVLAAPIMLLIGVPATGYLVAAGVWIVLRAIGVLVERLASSSGDARSQVGLRLTYMLGRLFVLAITVILVRNAGTKNDGLTALLVIVFAFTTQLATSFVIRPRSGQ
jgi:hypothetical protein